ALCSETTHFLCLQMSLIKDLCAPEEVGEGGCFISTLRKGSGSFISLRWRIICRRSGEAAASLPALLLHIQNWKVLQETLSYIYCSLKETSQTFKAGYMAPKKYFTEHCSNVRGQHYLLITC
ncbi:hypothetical protein ILYODFUR_021415, partial [Ilyodon furcidens]